MLQRAAPVFLHGEEVAERVVGGRVIVVPAEARLKGLSVGACGRCATKIDEAERSCGPGIGWGAFCELLRALKIVTRDEQFGEP